MTLVEKTLIVRSKNMIKIKKMQKYHLINTSILRSLVCRIWDRSEQKIWRSYFFVNLLGAASILCEILIRSVLITGEKKKKKKVLFGKKIKNRFLYCFS